MNIGTDEFLNIFNIISIIQKTSQYFNMHYLLVLVYILIKFMWYTL